MSKPRSLSRSLPRKYRKAIIDDFKVRLQVVSSDWYSNIPELREAMDSGEVTDEQVTSFHYDIDEAICDLLEYGPRGRRS